MGKAKKSKEKIQTAIAGQAINGSPDFSTESSVPRIAADGRDVEGWSSADINTYNELLLERAKLEREKHDLEYKAERRTTERALLNQNGANVDSLFAKQPGGDFKYTGRNACCLAFDDSCLAGSNPQAARCKHEICSRAKKLGISWMEMDTIKYYELRIFTEKSERMKNALRKQREVELVRVKKVEDEEYAAKSRKMALLDKADREALRKTSEASAKNAPGSSATEYQRDAVIEAAKQNDSELSQIRDELEDIRRQVDAGKVTSGDLRSKLDLAQGKMVEAERRNNLFRQMIVEVETVKTKVDAAVATHASLDEDLKKLCATAETAVAQAMTLMKDFFSASGPDQMEETMSRLKSTLEARGPMPKNMRESFKELEAMVAESKTKGLKMDFKVDYGGAVTGNSMVDTMTALRLKMKEGQNSQTNPGPELKLDKELIQANQGCLRVEDAAEKEMKKESQKSWKTSDALHQALTKIKDAAVAKSPIPPLSDIMLESKLQGLVDVHTAGVLAKKVEEGISDQEIAGRITSLVLAKAQNTPDKFLIAYSAVATSFDIATHNRVPEQINSQLRKVEKSMQAWVEKSTLNKKVNGSKREQPLKPAQTSNDHERPKPEILDTSQQLAIDQSQLQQGLGRLSDLGKLLRRPAGIDNELSTLIREFLKKHTGHIDWVFDTLWQGITGSSENPTAMMNRIESSQFDAEYEYKEPLAMLNYVSALHKAGYCARVTCALTTFALMKQAGLDPDRVDTDLRLLRGLLSRTESAAFEHTWFKSFQFNASTVVNLHTKLNRQLALKYADKALSIGYRCTLVFYAFFACVLSVIVDPATNSVNAKDTVGVVRFLFENYILELSEDIEESFRDLEVIALNTPFLCTGDKCKCVRPVTQQLKPQAAPSATSSNGPQMVTTFHKSQSQSAPQEKQAIEPVQSLEDLVAKGKKAAEGPIDCVKLYLRAHWVAKLDPPLELIAALRILVEAIHGSDPSRPNELSTYGGESEKVAIPHSRRSYNAGRWSSWRDSRLPIQCDSRLQTLGTLPKIGTSKFIEHLEQDEPEEISQINVNEKQSILVGARRRFLEIINGRTSPEYLSWIVLNLIHQAQIGTRSYLTEPIDDFISLFNTVGDMPDRLTLALDVARGRLEKIAVPELERLNLLPTPESTKPQNYGPCWEETSNMLEQVATADEAFKSEGEWQWYKEASHGHLLLTDEDYIEAFAEDRTNFLEETPGSLDSELESLMTNYEMAEIPAGKYFNTTMAQVKRCAHEGDFEKCRIQMRILAQMMISRWRLDDVPMLAFKSRKTTILFQEIRAEDRVGNDDSDTYDGKEKSSGDRFRVDGRIRRSKEKWLRITSQTEDAILKDKSTGSAPPVSGRSHSSNALVEKINSFFANAEKLEEIVEHPPASLSSALLPEAQQAMQLCLKKVRDLTENVMGCAMAIAKARGPKGRKGLPESSQEKESESVKESY